MISTAQGHLVNSRRGEAFAVIKFEYSFMPWTENASPLQLPSRKRGWGCVTVFLHTPLFPLFRGESKGLKFLYVKLRYKLAPSGAY